MSYTGKFRVGGRGRRMTNAHIDLSGHNYNSKYSNTTGHNLYIEPDMSNPRPNFLLLLFFSVGVFIYADNM